MRQETVIIERFFWSEENAKQEAERLMPWAAKIIQVDSGNHDYAFTGFESIADYDLFCEQN